MKKSFITVCVAAFAALAPASASAWDLQSLLRKAGETISDPSVITNVIDGVFATTKIDVKDLAGTWKVAGSAVSAKSEDAFGKATAVAGAAMLETQLDPYYTKYGLTGAIFTINTDGTFNMKMKKLSVNGTIEKDKSGNFRFHFNTFGATSIGNVETYISKSPSGLSIMFDTTRLQTIVSGIASASKLQMAQQASALLKNYDNIYVGFKLVPYSNADKKKK